MNETTHDHSEGRGSWHGYRLVAIEGPATFVQMGESSDWLTNESGANPTYWNSYGELSGTGADGPGGSYKVLTYRHNEGTGANFLMGDGHVNYMTPDEAYPDNLDRRHAMWRAYE